MEGEFFAKIQPIEIKGVNSLSGIQGHEKKSVNESLDMYENKRLKKRHFDESLDIDENKEDAGFTPRS